jgi:hypothetical protein
MRVGLEHLDVSGLAVDLPATGETADPHIRVRSAVGLEGILEQGPEGLRITDLAAERVDLNELLLVFGSVVLTQKDGASFATVRGTFARPNDGEVELDLEAGAVQVTALTVEVGTVHVRGELRVEGFRLWVRGGEGRIEGDRVHVSGFGLRVGSADVAATELDAEGLRLGWGEGGFWMEARTLSGPSVQLSVGGVRVDARGVTVRDLALQGPKVSLGEVQVTGAVVSGTVPPKAPTREAAAAPEPAARPSAQGPTFDWRLLDGISGQVDVDMHVDLTVPVIGHRRATHHFRIPIEGGSLDYRQLESDLSTLENTILDFAVRDDGTLVLERGIPLLPTRGRGKPILVWHLGPDDLSMAHDRRVRLAVLPTFRVAGASEKETPAKDAEMGAAPAEGAGSGSGLALRALGLANLEVRLAHGEVKGPVAGAIQHIVFTTLAVQGDLHHGASDAPKGGALRGHLEGLEARIAGLRISEGQSLDLQRLGLGRLTDLELRFRGLRPESLELQLSALSLSGFSLGEPAPP